MKIKKSPNEVFDAIVDPKKIGNFWFTSSSEKWESGKTVTMKYDEYNAEGAIHILEMIENEKIVFSWGTEHGAGTTVTMRIEQLDVSSTLIEVAENGLDEKDPDITNKMMDQKGGWLYMLCCLKAFLEHGISDLRASLVH